MTSRYAILLLLGVALALTQVFAVQLKDRITATAASEATTAQAAVSSTGCGYPAQGVRTCWRQCSLASLETNYILGWCYTAQSCSSDADCTNAKSVACGGGNGWTGKCRTDAGGWGTN